VLTDRKNLFVTNRVICSGEHKERLTLIVHRNSLTMSDDVMKTCLSEL